jgi:hypothetical protein
VLGCGPMEIANRHYTVVDTDSTVHVTHENLITLMSLVSQHSVVGTQHWRRNFVKSGHTLVTETVDDPFFNCIT